MINPDYIEMLGEYVLGRKKHILETQAIYKNKVLQSEDLSLNAVVFSALKHFLENDWPEDEFDSSTVSIPAFYDRINDVVFQMGLISIMGDEYQGYACLAHFWVEGERLEAFSEFYDATCILSARTPFHIINQIEKYL